ncbi:MAG: hypothetical protein KGJ28_12830 [Alphaproteobacteria bacterium]|nr:hypothetical protein [Alphaproteobacteria bacterium]
MSQSPGAAARPVPQARAPFVPQASPVWRLYRRLVRTEVAFFTPPDAVPDADVLKLCIQPAPTPGACNFSCPTIIIDLSPSEEELWNGIESKSRKVIRQAMREAITVNDVPLTEENWITFRAAHETLRSRKRKADALGVGQISDLVAKGEYVMTTSRNADGTVLSWHGYARNHTHVRLLNTVSAIDPARDTAWNNLVGRANRLHHWQDMLRFKSESIRHYDLGGVYRGEDDPEQMNIARFKKSFGGAIVDRFDAVLPLTGKGRIAVALSGLISAEARSGT